MLRRLSRPITSSLSLVVAASPSSRTCSGPLVSDVMKHIYAQGTVVKGFGRGSKQLGIPTANFDENVVSSLPADTKTGVYYGWARVDDGPVHKMVMSIGWNPYYHNEKKSMETHIMHKFDEDFYGSWLRVLICGYIRDEKNYDSLDDLIKDIERDIAEADRQLESSDMQRLKQDPFFKDRDSASPISSASNGSAAEPQR